MANSKRQQDINLEHGWHANASTTNDFHVFPDPAPLDWDRRGVVTLASAIRALRLAAARGVWRQWGSFRGRAIDQVWLTLESAIIRFAAKKLVQKELSKNVISYLLTVRAAIKENEAETEVETAIRREFTKEMKDLLGEALFGQNKRATHLVSTRHGDINTQPEP